ncbi:Prodigiosin synthesizing transferase PigC [Nymphon striatum]|nr:Prodigiosin synthesizing transferase PigC [Nymphon striatum]
MCANTLFLNTIFLRKLVFVGGLYGIAPSAAIAIPSPELVLGSVSSLSQIFAVGAASVAGFSTIIAKRMGISGTKSGAPSRAVTRLLMFFTRWLYYPWGVEHLAIRLSKRQRACSSSSHVGSTSSICSFVKQSKSANSITTEEASALLRGPNENTLFFDIRETAENAMGTLPNSQHIRFPDFLESNLPLAGKQVVLFCHNGNRSSETCAALAALGIDCRFIAGGIEKWIVEGREFSDANVTKLSDLRAIPDHPNKETLLSTTDFKSLKSTKNLQIIDTRYPGDFEAGHLPGAINIPVRALPTKELQRRISQLDSLPTITACYDRRSCFMAQVLGLELTQAGIEYQGRYTTPWEFFIPPPPKPHIQQWMLQQNETLWQKAVGTLANGLTWIGNQTHFVFALIALSLLSRLLVLPIALKSERDQIVLKAHSEELDALKTKLQHDPARKARAMQSFYSDKNLTPMRNLTALLFLPVMMLGLGAVENAAPKSSVGILWLADIGVPDAMYILPAVFAVLAGVYLHWAMSKTTTQVMMCWLLGVPAMFALVFQLSAAGNIYLCCSLVLLLIQRAYVVGITSLALTRAKELWLSVRSPHKLIGVVPLADTRKLTESGNKAYRLSVMRNAGIPVPNGVVIRAEGIEAFTKMTLSERQKFAKGVWAFAGKTTCAVRSSASNEDSADQSFAGIFDSVLNVEEADMLSALETVISSFHSGNASAYNTGEDDTADGNILIQHMVSAEYSGVLFTEDPTAPGLAMLELVEGSGEDLVSGRVTPQNFQFGRFTNASADNSFSPIDLKPLLKLGKSIERIFGCPQDIEWSYTKGQFQIVQSRDITTLFGGSIEERARLDEWRRILAQFSIADAEQNILEQDEMSEVLPRPTPLSFSLMAAIWSPGGSVDLACRQLGVNYNLPEGRPGHLVNLFGQTYVDCALKSAMTLRLSKSKAKQLRKQAVPMISQYRDVLIPTLEDEMAVWRATDFTALSDKLLISSIQQLHNYLLHEIYVEAEKINILAGFTMSEARAACQTNSGDLDRLLHPALSHAPVSIIDHCATLPIKEQRSALINSMGHRAVFDYELSTPRYAEAPELLWPLLEGARATATATDAFTGSLVDLDAIDLAIAFQDLKEQAKHESLKVVAELRRALLVLANRSQLNELIFHLEFQEIFDFETHDLNNLKTTATERKQKAKLLSAFGPRQVTLTLKDCELLSRGKLNSSDGAQQSIAGTCVSGSTASKGRVFVVEDESQTPAVAFEGFQEGDIIVCRMVNPAWLPYVLRSGGVLAEIGGWLSHMAIVAREKDLLMLVRCHGLDQLHNGLEIDVSTNGSIDILPAVTPQKRKTA